MSPAAPRAPRWPREAWDALVLRGLDERARGELEAAGRLRELAAGDEVFAAGDPADAIVVVVSGEVVLSAVPRGERTPQARRVARRGELVGEEAMVLAHGARPGEARARVPSVVAELPIAVLRRALGRGGDSGGGAARVHRALERAAARDVLAATALGSGLADAELEVLVDPVRHLHLVRGEVLFREGEEARGEVFVVASGLLQIRREEHGRVRVVGYLARGDVVGLEETAARGLRTVTASAPGATWALALPEAVLAKLSPAAGERARRTRRLRVVDAEGAPQPPAARTTALVFEDLYRFAIARSMLVIDQDACVRCGHCTWSCASAHEDGIARLARRGDKIVVATGEARSPLLVPTSCQHCRHPACMVDCPTGAIARDASGEVRIREELCTGCGACVKACPWDNIQLSARSGAPEEGSRPVAVKCDLCDGRDGGPACVSACPVEAIARIDPDAVLPGVAAVASSPAAVLPARMSAWPWTLGATLAALGLVALAPSRAVSGAGLAVLLLALGGGVALRRAPGAAWSAALRRALGARAGRVLHLAHVVVSVLAAGLALAHVGAPRLGGDVAGALTLAFVAAVATGVLGAVLHAVLPARLARLERVATLPEDLSARVRELEERLFGALSGRSDVVKALYARAIAPYVAARGGAVGLAASGRTLREEEAALRARLDVLLAGRKSDRLTGLDEIVRLAVEHRATKTVRLLQVVLLGWLAPHVVLAAVALVLLVLHVAVVLGGPR